MLRVLDPLADFPSASTTKSNLIVPRLDDLNGRVVGFLNHLGNAVGGSMPGTDPLLESVKSLLESRYHLAGVIWRTKPNLSRLVSAEVADELAAKADVVINGTCS